MDRGVDMERLGSLVGAAVVAAVAVGGLAFAAVDGSDEMSVAASAPGTAATSAVSPPATAPVQGPRAGSDRLPDADVRNGVGMEGGLVVTVEEIRTVEARGYGPGEIVGPAVAVVVRLRNDSQRPVNLNQLAVVVVDGDGVPASPSRSEPAEQPRGALRPGMETTGIYVFRFDGDTSDAVVEVSHGQSRQVAVFRS
jgi:hypothetical protein